MALFSTNQPSIRARLLPRFPAQVLAGSGILITKSGGAYIFSLAQGVIPISSLQPIGAGTLVGRGVTSPDTGPPEPITATGGLSFSGATLQMSSNQRTRTFNAIFNPVSAGIFLDFYFATAAIIRRVVLLANVAGAAKCDIWKTSFAGFPPTGANSICGTLQPELGPSPIAQKLLLESAQLTAANWTTAINPGDTLRLVVGTVTTITRLTFAVDAEII